MDSGSLFSPCSASGSHTGPCRDEGDASTSLSPAPHTPAALSTEESLQQNKTHGDATEPVALLKHSCHSPEHNKAPTVPLEEEENGFVGL